MSRTDKTRPGWVKVADTPMTTCVPVHDHRFGPCTLPDAINASTVFLGGRRDGCHWGPSASCDFHNGCRECTGYYFRRDERRRSRRRARRALRGYSGED